MFENMNYERNYEVNGFNYESANREKILKDIAEVFSDFVEMTFDMIETLKKDSLKTEMLVSACLAEYQLIRIKHQSNFSEDEIHNFSKMLELNSRCPKIANSIMEEIQKE